MMTHKKGHQGLNPGGHSLLVESLVNSLSPHFYNVPVWGR